jgi:hypothetical protein
MTFDFEMTNFAWNGSDGVVEILANRKIFFRRLILVGENWKKLKSEQITTAP